MKLELDGSNCTERKVVIIGVLDANPYALAVTQGKLTPLSKDDKSPVAAARRKKFETGN